MLPLVSIIIPTYNRGNLIKETLNSLLAQTYHNWECIVVDDGSTDHTDAVMLNYISRDARIKYHQRPPSHKPGGNGARNYGFSLSKGAYINWFDSDDVMAPNFIEARVQKFVEDPTIDVVFSMFENIDSEGDQTRIANQTFSGNILDDLVSGTVSFGPLSFLIKKSLLQGIRFNEDLKKNQDLDFFFRLFSTQPHLKIVHVNQILFTVRSHQNSMSYGAGADIKKMTSIYSVYIMILNYFIENQHGDGIVRYKKRSLNALKIMLRNGYYAQVATRLWHFKSISIFKRLFLLFVTMVYFFTKKGLHYFVKYNY